ncbi:MAG TPA: MFS transporter, partial [Mycobacterium sp.]|nr:MFS transporter [Mycobacterium sp.]
AGSLAPIIAVKLLEVYRSALPIALYLATAAVITLVALAFTRETRGLDLADVDRADVRRLTTTRATA